MIPFVNVKCEVPDCYNKLRVEIADGLKKQGKPAVCYEHKTYTIEDVKRMYEGLGTTSKLGTSA